MEETNIIVELGWTKWVQLLPIEVFQLLQGMEPQ